MSYTITPILHSEKTKGDTYKIQIRVLYDRKKIYCSTPFSVGKNQLENGKVIYHDSAEKINKWLRKEKNIIDKRIIDVIDRGVTSFDAIKEAIKGKSGGDTFVGFCEKYLAKYKANFSYETHRNFKSLYNKVDDFKYGVRVAEIDAKFMREFEIHLRENLPGNNTIVKHMQTFKSLMNKAAEEGLADKKKFDAYKKPRYIQTVPTWLTEAELHAYESAALVEKVPEKKQAGMYYLLACYTGYRMGTVKGFDYNKMVNGNRIVVRAKKNNAIVSMPIHKRLKVILDYCRANPLKLSEAWIRIYVKSVAIDAKIEKDVIFHSARHTFAMLLMSKGFTVDEAAELLGDTPLVSKVYARIHNEALDKKIMEKLG